MGEGRGVGGGCVAVRLFVAINVPATVRERVWDAAAGLRAGKLPVRWVRPESLHMTLKFLGDVDPGREREVARTVQGCVEGIRSFSVAVHGCGAFPSLSRPRVVWMGCQASATLALLQDRVERAMNALDFPNDGRVFRPHLTVGRVRPDARAGALRDLGDLADAVHVDETFTASAVDLMQSLLTPQGARYEALHSATLAEV